MILSRNRILEEISKGNIIYKLGEEKYIKDQSIDVSLGEWIYNTKLNAWHNCGDGPITLEPGVLYLCHTDEFIGTKAGSNLLPSIKLKSTSARKGIQHPLAGHGEVGFFNRWALEITVTTQTQVICGDLIAQVYFTVVDGDGTEDYSISGTYQHSSVVERVMDSWKPQDLLPPPLFKNKWD
ncbi:hypothetical protein EKK58_06105 [Candidatus Dependentiae bacterium]|nr:MAG: hypothetical protein EKK58_06105 [Candidatus Dependentiae bacterium]